MTLSLAHEPGQQAQASETMRAACPRGDLPLISSTLATPLLENLALGGLAVSKASSLREVTTATTQAYWHLQGTSRVGTTEGLAQFTG